MPLTILLGYSFSGNSFLKLNKIESTSELCTFRLRLRFEHVNKDMLLFSLQGGELNENTSQSDFVEANLINGFLHVSLVMVLLLLSLS